GPNNEILVGKTLPMSSGYLYADPDEAAKTFLPSGSIATGDVGRFDDDGYLYIVGRTKEIIITSSGHKIHPERVEAELDRCPAISKWVVFGDGLPHLVAVVSLRGERTEEAVAEAERFAESVASKLDGLRFGRILCTSEKFDQKSGLLTRNLKLDRAA